MSTGADTLCDTLAQALAARGVRHVFGMPGGVMLGFIDALRSHGIGFVLVRHEGSAGFMADVCAQLTGAPGVCLATLGPGATNLLSPVAGAFLERSQVLAITGQIGTEVHGRYTHQILDQVALFAPAVKHGCMLAAQTVERQLNDALHALDTGRPGPVHLDVPADVWETEGVVVESPSHSIPPSVAPFDLSAAAVALGAAKRPVIAVGLGDLSLGAATAVTALAERLSAPVITTYRALGMIPGEHPWNAGAFGLSPVVDEAQQALLAEADLLLAVGLDPVELRPQWLPGWPASLPMMLVDAHGQPDLCHPASWDLRGAVDEVLSQLGEQIGQGQSQWRSADIEAHLRKTAPVFEDGPDGPAQTIRAVQRGLGPNGIVSMDVGAHRITAAHVWQCDRPGMQLQSNGFSSMGVGLPGAIAAKLCCPDQPVVALTGDMGLWMRLGELGVVQERAMDLVVVYLADSSLSLIELKQERLGLVNHGVRFDNPAVEHVAAAFGGTGLKVRGAEAVEAAVAAAVAEGGLWVIEAGIDASHYRNQM